MCVRGLSASEGFSDLVAMLKQKAFLDCLGITEWALSYLKWPLKPFGEQVCLQLLLPHWKMEKTADHLSPCCLLQRAHISGLHKLAQTMI